MTPIYLSLAQGAVAGGTSCYLSNRVEKNTEDLWAVVAFEINHLLLLTAETIRFAGIPLGRFGLCVQSSFIALPLFLGASLWKKEVTPFEKKLANQINTLYRVGIVVIAIAIFSLSNPGFAIGSLSMLAIDFYANADIHRFLLKPLQAGATLLSSISYTAQAFAAESTIALMAKISSTVAWSGIFLQSPLRACLHREQTTYNKTEKELLIAPDEENMIYRT